MIQESLYLMKRPSGRETWMADFFREKEKLKIIKNSSKDCHLLCCVGCCIGRGANIGYDLLWFCSLIYDGGGNGYVGI